MLQKRRISIQSALVLLLGLTLVMVLWQLLEKESRNNAHQVSKNIIHQSSLRLKTYITSRFAAVQVLVRQFQRNMITSEKGFRQESTLLQEQFGGFQAVNYVTKTGTISWVVPQKGNKAARGRNLFRHAVASKALKAALKENKGMLTGPLTLYQGGRGFTSYHPIIKGKKKSGFINSVFRINDIIESAWRVSLLENFQVRITDQNKLVYESNDFDPKQLQVSELLPISNRNWLIQAYAKPEYWQRLKQNHNGFLISGFLITFLVALSYYYFQAQRLRLAFEKEEILMRAQSIDRLKALGRFAGGIAHDFRNYLNAIGAYAELIDRRPERQKKYLEKISQATKSAADLTDRLLSFAKDEPFELINIDLNQVITNAISVLEPLAPKNVLLNFSTSKEPAMVKLDQVRFEQVIVNLATNAFDAMPHGGKFTISLQVVKDKAEVNVSDTGIGMSTETKNRLFDPFFTTKPHGTGIGLATSLASLAKINAHIEVKTQLNKGTTFTIYVPLSMYA